MAEAKALQSHLAKSPEAAHHATASNDASAALLADAQKFSLELAASGTQAPTGGYTNNTDAITLPNIANDKINSVNNMSANDRKMWLHDFQVANGQSVYNTLPGIATTGAVRLDMSTGSNGKVGNFQITTENYDTNRQPSTAVIDATVGADGPQNVHFDASKTQAAFIADEISGFDFNNRNSRYPLTADRIGKWAAEAQAMPVASRNAMIQDAQKVFPKVKWNTDGQGEITSIDFNGQPITPTQWTQSVQADATGKVPESQRDAAETIADMKAAARPSDDDYYYDASGGGSTGGARSSGGSSRSESYPANGTVVQGVGANPGLYIANGDGSVSAW